MKTNRRTMLLSSLGALACHAITGAIEPLNRKGKPRLRLSLAAYSFRDQFKDPKLMTLPRFIDMCADEGLEGTELTSYYFPPEPSPEFLLSLKRQAHLRGVAVSGTSVGNNFALPDGPERDREIASVKQWIDRAAILGAPHIRVFAGSPKGISQEEGIQQVVKAFKETCAYAGTAGIFLGLENHGGVVATPEGMLEIIKAVDSPWFGVNLDTGNFHSDDPYAELVRIAPYAVNVQVKVEMKRGKNPPEPVDLPRLIRLLKDANYQGFVVLEYEAKEDPFTAVPLWLAKMREAMG